MSVLVEARALSRYYSVRRGLLQRHLGQVKALDGVDLKIQKGECVALVGESGSGKTTLGRCLIRLIEPSEGDVLFQGESLLSLPRRRLRQLRRQFQMVFQDPYGSLNPRMRVGKIIREPLDVHRLLPRRQRGERVEALLEQVGLSANAAHRFPHEFSGGQRQRIGIARALATEPKFLVADEPVSALDVSVQAQVMNLLADLQRRLNLAMLFIAHDLALVEHIADRVAVLYLGRLVEVASRSDLFQTPRHPYTVSLLSAVPVPDTTGRRSRIVLEGEPPSPMTPPSGCAFHPRCPVARARCREETPKLLSDVDGHAVACHYPGDLVLPRQGAPAKRREG